MHLQAIFKLSHCVKWAISYNLRDRGIPRHPANRRSERDVLGNVKCHRVVPDTYVAACQEKSWPGYVKCGVSGKIRALILNDTF